MDDLALYIFTADFNEDNIYEENGELNYNDNSKLMENIKTIYCCICKKEIIN